MCEKVSKKPATIEYAERRPGDPAVLVASSPKFEKISGWKPKRDLKELINRALERHIE